MYAIKFDDGSFMADSYNSPRAQLRLIAQLDRATTEVEALNAVQSGASYDVVAVGSSYAIRRIYNSQTTYLATVAGHAGFVQSAAQAMLYLQQQQAQMLANIMAAQAQMQTYISAALANL